MALDYLAIASRGAYPDPSSTTTAERAGFAVTAGLLGTMAIAVALDIIDTTIESLTTLRTIASTTVARTIASLTTLRTIESK